MPRLVKGGKLVYGLSRVGKDGRIVIPPDAMREYGFADGDRVILLSGSRTSGGFGLALKSTLLKSELAVLLESIPEVAGFTLPEAEVIARRGRRYGWTTVREGGYIVLPAATLAAYGVQAGDTLAVGRGSYVSIAFLARGRILAESLKHPELEIF